MAEILNENQNESYRFIFFEGIFCSPQFKKAVLKLQQKYIFETQYINYPWPHDIVYLDLCPRRLINLYRLFFLDNSLTPDIDRLIYRDSD